MEKQSSHKNKKEQTTMPNVYFRALLSIIILLLFTLNLSAVEFSLKLGGGLSHMKLESVNSSILDWVAWQKKNAQVQRRWDYLGGKITELHQSFDFDGEFFVAVNSLLSIGLSIGFIYGEITTRDTELTIERFGTQYLYTFPTKVNAYPVIFSGYLNLPVFNWLKFYLKGGTGIVWAKYFNSEGRKLNQEGANFNYPTSQKASSRGTIYKGGLGVLFHTNSGIDFFLEGSYRQSKITGFQGENKDNLKGTLFTYEEYDPVIEIWQTKITIQADKPAGEYIRSVEESEIDLSGFSVKTGIIIKF